MHDDDDEDAVREYVECKTPQCILPAEVLDRVVHPSTDGPIEVVRLRCLNNHLYYGEAGRTYA